jgi:hypothetical protein
VDLTELVQGLDGDILDIDWTPSTYAPDSGAAEASDDDDLAAHLKGIDDELGTLASGGGGGGLTWQTVSSNTTASVNNGYLVDSSVNMELPSSPTDGDVVAVAIADRSVDSVFIEGEGGITVEGSNFFVLDGQAKGVYLVYSSGENTWRFVLNEYKISLDIGNDGTNESTYLQEISTDNDSNHRGNSVVTEPNSDEARWDMGEEWPSQRLAYINHYVGGTLISNMDFTGSLVDPAGPFEGYLLWVDMLEMSSPTYPFIQFSDDSGSTWLSGSGYDYVLKNWGIGYVSSDSSGSAGSIRIGAGASNSNELVDRGYGSKIKISAGNSSITNGGEGVVCHAHYTRAKDSQVVNFQATGHYASGVDITGIRLGASGESFENYNVTLYGVSRA